MTGLIEMSSFIRKFGLKHCDLPSMIWNVSVLLRALALDISIREKTKVPAIFFLLLIITSGSYFYIYLVSMVWFVFWKCMETGDRLAAIIVFSQGVASLIGPVKLIYIMYRITKVRSIVMTCLYCDSTVVPGSRFSRNLLKILRNVKKRAILFWVTIMSNGLIYIMKPFMTPGRHLMDEQFVYYGLEPMYESPNYEIAITISIMGILFAAYTISSITAFVIINAGYVEAQMLSWSEELQHLWDDAKDHYSKTKSQTTPSPNQIDNDLDKNKHIILSIYLESRLKDVIRSHVRNIDLLQKIEDVLRIALAIDFFLLTIGLITELLGGLENTYMEVPFSFIQVATDCFTGQRLSDASVAFERAVFNCGWENFDRSNTRLVLLILQMSQKTMTLSSGGIATLSFSSLMSIVRSVYSAYTTFRHFLKP